MSTTIAGDQEGLSETRTNCELVARRRLLATAIKIDPSVVRGLEYYTGPVYEVELTFEINDDKGRPVRFGSVGGGGRYDGLVSRFMGQPVPATGFSIGVSRLQAALTALGKLADKPAPGPVVVTVFDRDRVADYQRMVSAIARRRHPRRTLSRQSEEHAASSSNMPTGAQRLASSCRARDEKARGEVTIKDLILGADIAGSDERARGLPEKTGRSAVRGSRGWAGRGGARTC